MPLELWAHQKAVIPKLLDGHFLLIWEPGVGKTLPALVAGLKMKGPILYLCPAAIVPQIAAVARSLPYPSIQVIQSYKTKFHPKHPAKLTIISYDQASVLPRWKELFAVQWAALICDEAHMLKTPSASRTRAVYGFKVGAKGALYNRASRIWLLTGTPVLNNPGELYTHVSRLWPHITERERIRKHAHWVQEFCEGFETPYGFKVTGGKNLAKLNQYLKPHWHMLTLAQARPNMPELIIDQFAVPVEQIDTEGLPEEAVQELERILAKAEQDEDYDASGDIQELVPHLASLRRRLGIAKSNLVAEYVRNELHGGVEKLVVFYYHKDVGTTLQFALRNFNPIIIDGSTRDKVAVVEQFKSDPSARVILVQIIAGGTGLDGLQHATNRAVLAEYVWTPGINKQAIHRLYRGGQSLPVRATYIVAEGTSDERVLTVNRRKEKIVQEVFADGNV
jgi:SWI/SNF-related matrix-associated actin-dependent regulator of chromatin subfamily A-like protein 1